jgi:hypothetical protein
MPNGVFTPFCIAYGSEKLKQEPGFVGSTRMTVLQRSCCWCLFVLLVASGMPEISLAEEGGQHEFLLFPSIDGFDSMDESDPSVKDSHTRASADILYSYSGEHFRFLGEYLWSTDESELERLQAGWTVVDTGMLWVGRFHSPARFWVSEFHHGQYMQTSITRPSLEQWEDQNGSTPSHITGLLYEFQQIRSNESAVEYVASVGLAPKFSGEELVPYDFLDPESGHGLSLTAKVAFRPRYFESTVLGVSSSWNEINVEPETVPGFADLDRIDQLTISLFANWQWQKFRLISSVVYYRSDMRSAGGSVTDSVTLAYLQPEYELTDDVTLFGRVDTGIDEDDSIFLRLLPAFLSHRNMLGVRWDFANSQALTLEVADASAQGPEDSHVHFKEFRLQWSAAFP